MIIPRIKNFTEGIQFFKKFTTFEQIYAVRPRIKHYIVSRDQFSNYGTILKEINDVINASKDSIIFLTQKSRVVVTAKLDPKNPGRPATAQEIERELANISVKNVLSNQKNIPLFKPDPGHVCLTLTDSLGNPEEMHTVSLMPDTTKLIAHGNAHLHRKLYGEFTGGLFRSKHTHFKEEVEKIAKLVANTTSNIVADITVVPFSSSELSRIQLISNINRAKLTPLYNLCKATFKEKLLENSDDISIQSCLEEMKHAVGALKFKNTLLNKSDEIMLAAYACTNAAVEVCFGDPHHLTKTVGIDLSTQATVTLCCSMSLIGEHEFFTFARNLGLYDDNVALIEGIDNDKIIRPKR